MINPHFNFLLLFFIREKEYLISCVQCRSNYRDILILSSVSHNSAVYARSSLSHRFSHTDEVLRNVSAIFTFKADSWNSIFGTKANFMEHLALLGYLYNNLFIFKIMFKHIYKAHNTFRRFSN